MTVVFEMLDAYLSQLHFLNYIFFSITKMVWWRQTISNLEHLDCRSLSSFSYIKSISLPISAEENRKYIDHGTKNCSQ